MRANETRLNKLLAEPDKQFSIPIYQRRYSWTEKQCTTLWDDIVKLGGKEGNAGHFIGSVVCYQQNDEDMPGEIKVKVVIDGQQRLTTLSLIMLAMIRSYEHLGEEGKRIASSIKRQYILNEEYSGEDKYKLVPTYEDKETYFAIVNEQEHELKNPSTQMLDNFNLFCEYLSDDEELLKKIYSGINRLDLVYIVLTKSQDNPQLIFESMNSTGLGLSQGDLLRNFLLLDMPPQEQEELYNGYWKPIEQDFGNNYASKFDYFLRDYLTMLESKTVKMGTEYEEYKEYFSDKGLSKEEMLKNLRKYSKFYTKIYNCDDADEDLNQLWKELKVQQVDVANPFLMQVYNDYANNELSKKDFIDIIKTINSYVYRRYICGIPTNSLNKTFAVLYNSVEKENYRISVIATLMLLEGYKEFPADEEFKEAFATKNIYTTRLKNYTLEKLENNNHLNGIKIDGKDISIEHILPETDNLKPYWREVLGENWKELQKDNIHRIGNLTLTKGVYNSQMSDLPFDEKIKVPGGIRDSHYRLSNDIVDKEKWDIEEIDKRSRRLAHQAINIWKYPDLTEEELKPYKNIYRHEKEIYENMDHLPKMIDKIVNIFNRLDNDIQNLDENVVKSINKHYIAYKYDYINFAEIIIYKWSITVILDIPPELLQDEKQLSENISDKGSWGTGNVRIKIQDDNNYEDILDLVRQSFYNEKNSNA